MQKVGSLSLMGNLLIVVLFSSLLMTNAWAKEYDASSFYRNFEGVAFKDQNNQLFSLDKLDNKLVLFNFIYTSCANVCLTQTKDLATVFKAMDASLKKDVRFVSISLDPEKDNPKNLKRFAQRMQAEQKDWYFLATNYQDMNVLTSRLTLFRKEPKVYIADPVAQAEQRKKEALVKDVKKLEDHATTLWLIDKTGHIIQTYAGSPVDVTRLERELKELHHLQYVKP